jgi:eukaryotic-like serine/threonine-protein kinase
LPGLLQRLRLYDEEGKRWRAWSAPARLTLQVGALGAVAELRKVWWETRGRERRGEAWSLGAGQWEEVAVPAGDWWLEVRAPGHEAVGMPLRLERGEQRRVEVPLLRHGQVPEGYVYVPPGRVLFGSAAEAPLREFFNTVPLHERPVEGFLIARHETTYGEWLTWLDSLPGEERERRAPRVGVAYRGMLALERLSGRWRLRLHMGGESYEAWAGERLRYARREQRAEQDWLRMPVTGISLDDAEAYAAWLAHTGRVPGARLCTELEWERAARGEDGREYPHGNTLAAGEANFDLTYGKQPGGFGPDEVGSHPASRSPFGVEDMAGNVWEWTRSVLEPGRGVARGGAYYYAAGSARASNRELPEPTLRDTTVGMRVCADVSGLRMHPLPLGAEH